MLSVINIASYLQAISPAAMVLYTIRRFSYTAVESETHSKRGTDIDRIMAPNTWHKRAAQPGTVDGDKTACERND